MRKRLEVTTAVTMHARCAVTRPRRMKECPVTSSAALALFKTALSGGRSVKREEISIACGQSRHAAFAIISANSTGRYKTEAFNNCRAAGFDGAAVGARCSRRNRTPYQK